MSKPTRVVDFEHFLNDGELPSELPLRARALALAQIVEVGGPVPPGHTRETTIGCKRRPGGRACPGILWVLKEDDNSISTFCQA